MKEEKSPQEIQLIESEKRMASYRLTISQMRERIFQMRWYDADGTINDKVTQVWHEKVNHLASQPEVSCHFQPRNVFHSEMNERYLKDMAKALLTLNKQFNQREQQFRVYPRLI